MKVVARAGRVLAGTALLIAMVAGTRWLLNKDSATKGSDIAGVLSLPVAIVFGVAGVVIGVLTYVQTNRTEDQKSLATKLLLAPSVGNLPANHIARPQLQTKLRSALLDSRRGQSRRVGVWGMGGSGKSVLVSALAKDRGVRRRFPDGVLWVQLEPPIGDDAARRSWLTQKQQELISTLTPDRPGATAITAVEQGRNRLGQLLGSRKIVLVVDNVWTSADIHAFDIVGDRAALVLTTRDVRLVRDSGAKPVEVSELTDQQAWALAAEWAGPAPDALPAQATQALIAVGNLALGVATIAAIARDDRQRWTDMTTRLREANLDALKLQFPGYPHLTLLAALGLGLEYFEPAARALYRELAVFAGQGPVPRAAVEVLWSHTSPSSTDVGDLLAGLADRALLTYCPVTGHIELHDLQYDVARANIGDGGLLAAHQQLLAGYAAHCPRGWASGPDDGYFYQHLAHHMAAAGRISDLDALLTSLEWMQARLHAGGVSGLLADYDTRPGAAQLALVRATLRLSAHILALAPEQLRPQLAGRTIGRTEPALARLHADALALPGGTWLCPIWPTLAQPGQTVQQTLTGHTGWVRAVALTADEHTAISGDSNGTVRVCDLGGTKPPRILVTHRLDRRAVLTNVALSANGRTAISGGAVLERPVRVWDLSGTNPPRVLTRRGAGFQVVLALSADGQTAIAARGGRIRVWDLADLGPPRVLTGHSDRVQAVALSADGRTAISGTSNGEVLMWDLTGSDPPRELTGHTGEVHVAALSTDARTAVTGDATGTLRVWDLADLGPPRVLTGHSDRVHAVALSADGRTAISGHNNGTVMVWDLTGTKPPRELTGHSDRVQAAALSADGRTAISGDSNGTVIVWDLARADRPRELTVHTYWVHAVGFSADGRTAIRGDAHGTLRVWDLTGTKPPRELTDHLRVTAVALSADLRVTAVALSADGRTAITGDATGTVLLWDLAAPSPPRELAGRTDGMEVVLDDRRKHLVHAVALSADGRTAISGHNNGTVMVWDLTGADPPRELTGHTQLVLAVALSADGRTAISGGSDGTALVWDLADLGPPRELIGHIYWVEAVALSADGRTAISGGRNGEVLVWDLTGADPPRELTGHTDRVQAVALSADGHTLATGDSNGTVRVWNLTEDMSPQELARWDSESAVHALGINTDLVYVAGARRIHALQLRTAAT